LILLLLTSFFCCVNSAIADETDISDSSATKQEIFEDSYTKSPTGALVRSFILPGWGQLYVGSYWKAPIFFTGAATLTYFIIQNHLDYADYRDKYNKMSNKTSTEALTLRNNREFYRDNRDMSAFYLLGVYALAAVDAYVGAHLFDFSVDSDYSIYLTKRYDGMNINFQYKIK